MKNTNKVDENSEYVTKGFLKEALTEAFENFAQRLAPMFEGITKRLDRVEGRIDTVEVRLDKIDGKIHNIEGKFEIMEGKIDTIEGGMVTKKDLIQLHGTFASKSEVTGLSSRVGII